MAFLDGDDKKKIKVQVTGAVIMYVLVLIWPIITGFIKSADAGVEGLKIARETEIRQDTLELRCARKNFEDALFKQEIRQKLEHYDEGQQEIKGDLKWIREKLDKNH